MKKRPSIHFLTRCEGSSRACGRQYGESHAEEIEAFLYMTVQPNPKRLAYARRCWKKLQGWERHVTEFIRGMAEGSHLRIEEVTLLLLHEEVFHTKPCTGIGATRDGTKDGSAIIGQTWDWNSNLYAWSRLTRVKARGVPEAILYSYPGLWACAGINEHGFSLVWTGAGYMPLVKPKVGIPTYAIIPALLAKRTCAQAIDLLHRTSAAGSFIFFIADAKGEVWVIESCNGHFNMVRCEDIITRANHYECAASVRRSKQNIDPVLNPNTSTFYRGPRAAELARVYNGKFDRHVMEKCLNDEVGGPGKMICQRPKNQLRGISIDSFYCIPAKREFWIARGIQSRHEYARYKV